MTAAASPPDIAAKPGDPLALPLALGLHDGAPDRLHYGLVLALSAAAMGRRVTLFLAGRAVALLWADDWAAQGLDAFEATLAAKRVATLREMRDLLAPLDITVLVCETALRLAGREDQPFDPAWGAVRAGAVSFLEAGRGGQTLFI